LSNQSNGAKRSCYKLEVRNEISSLLFPPIIICDAFCDHIAHRVKAINVTIKGTAGCEISPTVSSYINIVGCLQILSNEVTIKPFKMVGQYYVNGESMLSGPSSARRNKKIIKNYEYSPGTLTRARFFLMIA
jgi:hypothetical protein